MIFFFYFFCCSVLLVVAPELVGRLFPHRARTRMGALPPQTLLWMCVFVFTGITEVCGKLDFVSCSFVFCFFCFFMFMPVLPRIFSEEVFSTVWRQGFNSTKTLKICSQSASWTEHNCSSKRSGSGCQCFFQSVATRKNSESSDSGGMHRDLSFVQNR